MHICEQTLLKRSFGFERQDKSCERFEAPYPSYDLGILSQRNHADYDMCRVVPDEEVRNSRIQLSSTERIIGQLGLHRQLHYLDMSNPSSLEKAMLTLRYLSRNSWTSRDVLLSRRTWCKSWMTLLNIHVSFRECWAHGLSVMSPSNMSSAGGPRLVRTVVLSALLATSDSPKVNSYPTPVKASVSAPTWLMNLLTVSTLKKIHNQPVVNY